MSEADETVVNDLLGGSVRLLQPKHGYRAATDPVLLAAAVDASEGDLVLDLGCGAGAATMCLGRRIEGLDLHGLELQATYAELARRNGVLNEIPVTLHLGDLRAMPDALKALNFDTVMMNPPWHATDAIGSPEAGRDIANRLRMELTVWISAALSRVRPRGSVILIQRMEWLPLILSSLVERAGDIAVLPLAAREGRPAKRVIVKARKGTNGPFHLAPPLVIHQGDTHPGDKEHYSDIVRGVLRDGAALTF